jgi:hypothetical protein
MKAKWFRNCKKFMEKGLTKVAGYYNNHKIEVAKWTIFR